MKTKIIHKAPIMVMKLTNEDWAPSFLIHGMMGGKQSPRLLRVKFHGRLSDGKFRTSVWGADDFGLEYDTNTEGKAWKKFQEVISVEYVSRSSLKKLGFRMA